MNRTFYTLRHGQTDWNAAGKLQGHSDIRLNATGHEQTRAAAVLLQGRGITRIVSSDLLRTRETAEPVAALLGIPVHFDMRMREATYGVIEGLTAAEMSARPHDELFSHRRESDQVFTYKLKDERNHFVPHGGESLGELDARVIECAREYHENYPDDVFLFVTHGGPTRSFARHFFGTSEAAKNAVPMMFEFKDGCWALQELKAG